MNRSFIQLCASAVIAAASASASAITDISQVPGSNFGFYGLISYGSASNSLQLTSDTFITGNVAIGSGQNVQGSGSAITGEIDNDNATGANISGASATGGIVSNTGGTAGLRAAGAIADAMSLFSNYTASTYISSTTNRLTSGSIIAGTTSALNYNSQANEFVYNLETNTLANAATINITASASQYVIIDVIDTNGGNANFQLGSVSLSGGITSSHVLINFDSSAGQLSGKSSDVINAMVNAGAGTLNFDAGTVNGLIACTTAAGNCSVVSNATIDSTVIVSATPEPMSFVLAGSGLLLVSAFGRRQS